MEYDPTAIEPEENPDPPEDFEPQTDLAPGQTGGIQERPDDLISDVEAELEDLDLEGAADEEDDTDDEVVRYHLRDHEGADSDAQTS